MAQKMSTFNENKLSRLPKKAVKRTVSSPETCGESSGLSLRRERRYDEGIIVLIFKSLSFVIVTRIHYIKLWI